MMMIGFPEISWEHTYQLWQYATMNGPEVLKQPVKVKEIPVAQSMEVFGYRWLTQAEFARQQAMDEKEMAVYLTFTPADAKGPRHTLQMLEEAVDDEERAAIWIAAYAHDLQEDAQGDTHRYAFALERACRTFLNERYAIWHHAMKHRLPMCYGSAMAESSVQIGAFTPIIEQAAMNAALLLYEYVPLVYTCLPPGERPEDSQLHV